MLSSTTESEVCKLETLLQSEVSVVTSGEAGSVDSIQGLSALRRRKRLGSRRANDTEREGATTAGSPERGERGLGDDRDRRDSGKWTGSRHTQEANICTFSFKCILGQSCYPISHMPNPTSRC